jgi:hypothetical protein
VTKWQKVQKYGHIFLGCEVACVTLKSKRKREEKPKKKGREKLESSQRKSGDREYGGRRKDRRIEDRCVCVYPFLSGINKKKRKWRRN